MNETAEPIVILGVGNVLLRDDGVGVHVVREIENLVGTGAIDLPAGTSLVDGGTLGLRLLATVSSAGALVVVDAAELGRRPGTIEVHALAGPLPGNDPIRSALGTTGEPDAIDRTFIAARSGIADLLAVTKLAGLHPASVTLVGVQPGDIDIGLEMTRPVAAAMPAVVRAVLGAVRAVAADNLPPESSVHAQVQQVAGALA